MNEPSSKNKAVLIIDDNESTSLLIKLQLESIGVEVDCAPSLNAARKFLFKKYDVIACDFNLGNGVNGLDIIKMYKVNFPYIRSILYTQREDNIFELSVGENVDKIIQGHDISDIVSCIKIFCISELETQIIDSIFNEINRIKVSLSTAQKSLLEVKNLTTAVENIHIRVNSFINDHKNDSLKVIVAFGALEALRALWEKFFH